MSEGGGGWPDLAGRLESGLHTLPVRVYYEDTDFSGIVYHASYLRFMERGRSDFLRLSGIHHSALHEGAEGQRMSFAVVRMEIDFLKPARIDDVLEVRTWLLGARHASFDLAQRVMRGADLLIDTRVRAALIGAHGRPHKLPPAMRTLFEGYREAALGSAFTRD